MVVDVNKLSKICLEKYGMNLSILTVISTGSTYQGLVAMPTKIFGSQIPGLC